MNITIGSDNFDIVSISQLPAISRAAIYTIWTHNPSLGSFPLLYIGETGDLGARLDTNHHKYQSWVSNAINGVLYVAVRFMPSHIYSMDQRKSEEQRLINLYRPVCNG